MSGDKTQDLHADMTQEEALRLVSRSRLYYLQDKRSQVGNSMMWWRKGGAGYCCDVREAHVFTREEAYKQHAMRSTDIPWPKEYIDARVSHHVDFQKVDLELALAAFEGER